MENRHEGAKGKHRKHQLKGLFGRIHSKLDIYLLIINYYYYQWMIGRDLYLVLVLQNLNIRD